MSKEVWKDIKGYEGLYQISNYGNVRSLITNKILKSYKNKNGYIYICLCVNNHKKMFRVHKLVAEVFIDNPRNYPIINHIDGNKSNNRADNLEWCTRSHNIKEAFRLNLSKSNFDKSLYNKSGNKNPRCKKVNQFDLKGNFIKKWDSIKSINDELGFSSAYICGCCKGNHQTAYGYVWKYKKEEE